MREKKRNVILIIIVIVSVMFLATNILISELSKRQGELAKVNLNVIENVSAEDQGRNIQEESKAINSNYADAKAWLKVPGTNIDTIVFQGADNERYLRHDRDNKKTKWGEVFLDYRSNTNKLDTMSNLIIYGHNSDDGYNFSALLRYKDPNFYKNNKIIELSTINGNYKWEVFTVYVTKSSFYYIDTNFANATEYSNFLKTVASMSMYNTGVTISGDEPILTLSTCDYTINDGRFVVQARLIK